uniref:Speckle-type POZ protein (inferred by orthology to a human protein) n=1 Tax=Strongyloides venezuelensis TaxID=75913 RepID=A0A0K0F517_STRVS
MSKQTFNETDYFCTCHQFLKCTMVSNEDNELLSNGKLRVDCHIFYYYGAINNVGFLKNNNVYKPFDVLLADIAGLLGSPNFSGFVIKVRDSKINVHKRVHVNRPEVFDLFPTDEQCKYNSNVIKTNGFNQEFVEEMVKFICTRESPNMDKMTCAILKLAEKYKLEQLKLMAEKILLHNFELYSNEILKEWCLQFICLNAQKVFNTEKGKVVLNDHPSLIAKLFNTEINKV